MDDTRKTFVVHRRTVQTFAAWDTAVAEDWRAAWELVESVGLKQSVTLNVHEVVTLSEFNPWDGTTTVVAEVVDGDIREFGDEDEYV